MKIRRKTFAFLSGAILISGAVQAQSSISLQFIGRYASNTYDAGGTEIVGYDYTSKKLFSVNASTGDLDIINLTNPFTPTLLASIDLAPFGNAANSVAVKNGVVAAAIENANKQLPGKAVFFDTNGNLLDSVTVGALPDMICFTPDGMKVLVANEGEPNSTYTLDPEGSVSIIDISGGVSNLTQANVTTAGFTAFNSGPLDPSIRIFGPGSTVAQDLEPEYITVAANSQTAWVTLQEGNAIGILNLQTNSFVALKGLGYKDHNIPGNGMDASDQNSGNINIANWPVKGMYQPDAITSVRYNGQTYLITANEGDAREYSALNEVSRISSRVLDPTAFPNAAILQNNNNLGRLNITNRFGDTDNDGDFDVLYSFGSRSFSVWDSAGSLVFDSGDDFEQLTSASNTTNFNCSNTNNTKKNRSDDKGPEAEAVITAQIGDSMYAFVGLERIGGIMVYNITNPLAPYYVQYINSRNFGQTPALNMGADLGPEGLLFIPKAQSPNGRNLLIAANEISGTISIYQINIGLSQGSDIALDTYDLYDSLLIGNYQGNNLYEGGFSGLHCIPGTNMEFYVNSDRGPNLDAGSHPNASGTTLLFPFPNYAPKIHRIKLQNDSIRILNTMNMKRPGGSNQTGLPNPPGSGGTGEVAWSDTNPTILSPDAWGTDPEGIVEGNQDDLYISEEYGATFARYNKTTGELINRYTPFGVSANNIAIDTMFKKRVPNRGFEGVTFAPNGKVYAIVQSPLANPNTAASDASRLHRIIEYDMNTGTQKMYAYEHDAPIGGSSGMRNKDWKIGDFVAINNTEFLVLEHGERNGFNFKNVYKINISAATPIVSENYSGQTFEQLADAATAITRGVTPVTKTPLLDLLECNWDLSHDKPEGITIINDSTIAIVNDNDYGINSPNADGNIVMTNKTTRVYVYHLPSPLNLCYPVTSPLASASAVCTGDTAVLTSPSTGLGYTYQWKLNNTNIVGATSPTYSALTAGNYSIVVNTPGGCSATSPNIAITVNPLPVSTITPLGSTSFCDGNQLTMITSNTPGYSYQWMNNGQPIAGANASAWTADSSGVYSVQVTVNSTGCSTTTSSPVTVNVFQNPVASFSVNGPLAFCSYDSTQLVAVTSSGLNYQWTLNGQPVNGATGSTYTPAQPGNYSLEVTDANGCTDAASNSTGITIYPAPAQPVITANGLLLTSTASATYQWYLNGQPIGGANGQSHAAGTTGWYEVMITDANGCTAVSDSVFSLITGTAELTSAGMLNAFPNPYRDETNIRVLVPNNADMKLEVFNTLGERIATIANGNFAAGTYKFSFSAQSYGYAAGLYLLRLEINNEVYVIKLAEGN
ncbi:MAG: hypothetical protein FD123_2367 [Bacteroidetes bacterium]|nr:MAG: hypothetical protein FD123_2367 [Bacteroidota bacterium]